MKFAMIRSIALHVAVIALIAGVGAGCSTVAGVGQDVQDVANWSRNKIVEKVNQPKVYESELTVEELEAQPDDQNI